MESHTQAQFEVAEASIVVSKQLSLHFKEQPPKPTSPNHLSTQHSSSSNNSQNFEAP